MKKPQCLLLILSALLCFASTLGARVHVPNISDPVDNGGDDDECRWGEPCHSEATKTASTTESLPFVRSSNSQVKHDPPSGFTITARVYTSPEDKLAHFDSSLLKLDYQTCGVAGSTTSALPIKHAYFRHSLSSSKPTIYQGTEYGPHPQLLIALSAITMELNSGEVRDFQEGSVILLEDVVSGGHKLKSHDTDVVVLILTLPQHYHYVGKERTSLPDGQKLQCNEDGTMARKLTRKYILGGIGMGLTLIAADWLGKVAPLWLSVGIGGGCFVVGGTWAVIEGGDRLVDSIQYMREQRRMKQEEIETGGVETAGVEPAVDTI
jgi:hypothetical protein